MLSNFFHRQHDIDGNTTFAQLTLTAFIGIFKSRGAAAPRKKMKPVEGGDRQPAGGENPPATRFLPDSVLARLCST
jgi:hypothetical protein